MQAIILSLHLQLCRPEDYAEVETLIRVTLNEDVHHSTKPTDLRNQRVYAIRVSYCSPVPIRKLNISQAGVNGFLDVARQTYKEINDDVFQLVEQLNSKTPWPNSPFQLTHNLPNFKTTTNSPST
jgi:DNA mismatch repair protein MSH4